METCLQMCQRPWDCQAKKIQNIMPLSLVLYDNTLTSYSSHLLNN